MLGPIYQGNYTDDISSIGDEMSTSRLWHPTATYFIQQFYTAHVLPGSTTLSNNNSCLIHVIKISVCRWSSDRQMADGFHQSSQSMRNIDRPDMQAYVSDNDDDYSDTVNSLSNVSLTYYSLVSPITDYCVKLNHENIKFLSLLLKSYWFTDPKIDLKLPYHISSSVI